MCVNCDSVQVWECDSCREHREGMARSNFSQDPGGVWFWAVTTCPCLHFIVPTLSSSVVGWLRMDPITYLFTVKKMMAITMLITALPSWVSSSLPHL